MSLTDDLADEYGNVILGLCTYVLADRLPPEKVTGSKLLHIEVPATWWQYFKFQHEPSRWLGWFVRRRPVKWISKDFIFRMDVDISRFRTFPEAKVLFPADEFGRPRKQSIVHSGSIRGSWK